LDRDTEWAWIGAVVASIALVRSADFDLRRTGAFILMTAVER
jgi:hypothetical protein